MRWARLQHPTMSIASLCHLAREIPVDMPEHED